MPSPPGYLPNPGITSRSPELQVDGNVQQSFKCQKEILYELCKFGALEKSDEL